MRVQCNAQTHNIATAMAGSTADRGTTSKTSTAEALGMPGALTDLNGGSAINGSSLKHLEKALLSPNTTLLTTGISGLMSMTSGNSGVSSMVAEDLGVAFITAGGCGVTNQTGEVATLADEVAGKEAALAGGGSGLAAILGADSSCDMTAILGPDLDMVAILNLDSGCDMAAILSADSDWSIAAILGIGFGMGVVTNTALAIISVWHGGNPGRPDSVSTGAHGLLPPPEKMF